MADQPLYPDLPTFDRANLIGRDNWRTPIPAGSLREHIGLAIDHHHDRETWWNDEAETVKQKIGTDGLQVREQQISGGSRHDVVIDPTLSARLSECEAKAQSHRNKIELLERYDAFLELVGQAEVLITASDAAFFELGQHSPED